MPVLVPGEPYAEHREERLRTQYAVLTALARSKYELSLPTRISYVRGEIDTVYGVTDDVVHNRPLVVPVKLFKPIDDASPLPYVQLCWINESQLGDRPLAALSNILSALFPRESQDSLRLSIVGPSSSNVLKTMLTEAPTIRNLYGAGRFMSNAEPDSGPKLYSARANVDQYRWWDAVLQRFSIYPAWADETPRSLVI